MTDAINSHSRRMYNAQKNTRADLANPLDDPRVKALVEALRRMVYETTSLSPLEDDGSHWCKISKDALAQARAALSALEENK